MADSETVLVGVSQRTNEKGADKLAKFLFAARSFSGSSGSSWKRWANAERIWVPLRITWILRSPFRKPPGLEVGNKVGQRTQKQNGTEQTIFSCMSGTAL